ncbi:MAG: hypothetical protein ACI39W_01330 [Brotaphodocola sp.]
MEWLSKETKRTLIEMSVGIILFDLLLCILAWICLPRIPYPVIPVLKGLGVGAAAAILMLIHMAVVTERVLSSQNESYANKHTVAQSMLRKIVFLAALFFVWRTFQADLLATVIGTMGMKAGAYLQPLIRKLSGYKEEKREELPEQTDSESI